MVRYSDELFFGTIDTNNTFNSKTTLQSNLILVIDSFVIGLIQTAINSTNLFTNSSLKPDGLTYTFYGVAQCTLDLSPDNCDLCLHTARYLIPKCCAGFESVIILYGSCNLRYEIHNFLTT
ncbi:hypothetical protein CASFOL_040881 [Castilleja foliolosa]|uniref:Gnk2-homologous domain-containing protein n=1 Tax=Castilleja foliolosa TaxID=1961234 RepID=A0ABD3BEG7_9LAMI